MPHRRVRLANKRGKEGITIQYYRNGIGKEKIPQAAGENREAAFQLHSAVSGPASS